MGGSIDKGGTETAKRKPESPIAETSVPKIGRGDIWNLLYKVCADVLGAKGIKEDTKQALKEKREILGRKKETQEQETQTIGREIDKDQNVVKIRHRLEETKTLEKILTLMQLKWPEAAFVKTNSVPRMEGEATKRRRWTTRTAS